ncbi:MAG: endonuclease/exonuclease/phosphatase family protein [Spirochaetaceae bacterium]
MLGVSALVVALVGFSRSSQSAQTSQSSFDAEPIAHAGGAHAGATYTNSVEALRANAEDYRLFELDFEWTADDRLVGLHDWEGVFERLYGFEPEGPLPYEELRGLDNRPGVTPVDVDDLAAFLAEHPDVRLVTDVKRDNLRALARIAERLEDHGRRVIPQIYHPDEAAEVLELGYERFIWTLYRFRGNRSPERVFFEARTLVERHGDALYAVAMPVPVVEDGTAERLAARGIRTYAHTINTCREYERLRELGVDGIYTDELARSDCGGVVEQEPWHRSGGRTEGGKRRVSSLRVLSFNLCAAGASHGENAWARRRELAFEVLRRLEPDVAGLQEVEAEQLRQLARRFPEYRFLGHDTVRGVSARKAVGSASPGGDLASGTGMFNALMVREDRFSFEDEGTFWLSEQPEEAGSRVSGASEARTATWAQLVDRLSGRRVHLYNLHLDYASQEAREVGVSRLIERIRAHGRDDGRDHGRGHRQDPVVLVTGDFNANIRNPALGLLLSRPRAEGGDADPRPLVDTFRVRHPEAPHGRETGTFHEFTGEPQTTKIDFILAPRGVEVAEAGIDRRGAGARYPSDHFPVYAELHLRLTKS